MTGRTRSERSGAIAPPDDPLARAKAKALRMLEGRARSVFDVRARLRQSSFDDETIDSVITRLSEVGVLNDADFAREFARQASAKGTSTDAIRRGLRAQEISEETIEAALEENGVPGDSESVEAVAARKARSYANLPRDVAVRRLAAYLYRRGYQPDLVDRACRSVLEGAEID